MNILKKEFSLIPEVSRTLFVHSLHLQALFNVNMAFGFFGVTNPKQLD